MYLTTQQAAERLGVSYDRIKLLVEQGALPTLPSNGTRKYYRIDEHAVTAYKKQLRTVAPAAVAVEVAKPVTVEQAPPEGFVTTEEAARISGLVKNSLFSRAMRGTLDRVKIGNVVYFRAAQLTPPRAVTHSNVAPAAKLLTKTDAETHHAATSIGARLSHIEAQIASLTARLDALVSELGGLW